MNSHFVGHIVVCRIPRHLSKIDLDMNSQQHILVHNMIDLLMPFGNMSDRILVHNHCMQLHHCIDHIVHPDKFFEDLDQPSSWLRH